LPKIVGQCVTAWLPMIESLMMEMNAAMPPPTMTPPIPDNMPPPTPEELQQICELNYKVAWQRSDHAWAAQLTAKVAEQCLQASAQNGLVLQENRRIMKVLQKLVQNDAVRRRDVEPAIEKIAASLQQREAEAPHVSALEHSLHSVCRMPGQHGSLESSAAEVLNLVMPIFHDLKEASAADFHPNIAPMRQASSTDAACRQAWSPGKDAFGSSSSMVADPSEEAKKPPRRRRNLCGSVRRKRKELNAAKLAAEKELLQHDIEAIEEDSAATDNEADQVREVLGSQP